jgi:GxxExxY protein
VALLCVVWNRSPGFRTVAPAAAHRTEAPDRHFRTDEVVEKSFVVEIKAAEHIVKTERVRLLPYLTLRGGPPDMLINFQSPLLI